MSKLVNWLIGKIVYWVIGCISDVGFRKSDI